MLEYGGRLADWFGSMNYPISTYLARLFTQNHQLGGGRVGRKPLFTFTILLQGKIGTGRTVSKFIFRGF